MDDSEQRLNEEVIQLLDDFLNAEESQRTLFLKISHKRITEFRDRFKASRDAYLSRRTSESSSLPSSAAAGGHRKVFIALYLANGNNLQQWKSVLKSLASKVVGRPVYAEEEHVRQAIRARGNSLQEAYVSVYIAESDILQDPASQGLQDRAGNPLLMLMENAVTSDRIDAFVHANQNYYRFRDGQLLLSDD